MDVQKLSENGLKGLHKSIRKALDADKANPNKADPWYGVEEFPDWGQFRDELESELKRRHLPFDPITW